MITSQTEMHAAELQRNYFEMPPKVGPKHYYKTYKEPQITKQIHYKCTDFKDSLQRTREQNGVRDL